ncbi:MAG: glycosyltransferase family 1 protein [Phycisphaerae bacterium]|nr:glycosyltransferase family 1 protein [Phycisphaerae bacterium]
MPDRPPRILWYTDTLGDVNGVSRFVRNMADQALVRRCEVTVVTSTSFAVPDQANIINLAPVWAAKMPKYEQLEIVLPPVFRMLRHAKGSRPDLIHVSTPGPVGLIGLLAARRLRVPLIGTYHTDFPAYIDRLFDDDACTALCTRAMRSFYGRCRVVISRSQSFIEPIRRLGIAAERIAVLRAGIDLESFGPGFRDESIWERVGAGAGGDAVVRVLYVGRVSVEKNLRLLERAWSRVHAAAGRLGVAADLIVVGDGPYLAEMKDRLAGMRAHFLGFRHGQELASLYASSDLFVFPSTTDTLGQSVMEAQASSLPAIVSGRGGPRTIVSHGETGLVVDSERESDWADAVLSLIADPSRRARFAREAAGRMAGRGIAASFLDFMRICERAVGRNGPAPPGDMAG